MKKIGMIFSCIMIFILTGCSSSYERDNNPGEVVNITVDKLQQMMDDKESFAIVFTKTTCDHCQTFHTMLDGYILDHHIVLYEVVLDEAAEAEQKANLSQIQKLFPSMTETPSLYYVKDGKEENRLSTDEEAITKARFDDWVVNYRLDEKKEGN